jgi:hypothetical protein
MGALWVPLFMVKYISLVGTSINQLKTSTLKPTKGAVVVISKTKTIEAGRAAYKRPSFTFKIFKKKLIANITLVILFNEIIFYVFILSVILWVYVIISS